LDRRRDLGMAYSAWDAPKEDGKKRLVLTWVGLNWAPAVVAAPWDSPCPVE
jgi:hypothetical protein